MSKEPTLSELGDMIAHVVKHMATRDDIAELRSELTKKIDDVHDNLTAKIEGINRRLDTEAIERTRLRLPERVEAIERHLGIGRVISH